MYRLEANEKLPAEKAKIEPLRRWYKEILRKYESLPLTLPISDIAMRRICQVLTDYEYITSDSCEGHGKALPHIFFQGKDQDHLRDLTHVVCHELHYLNHFPWQIRTFCGDPYLNPDSKLLYVLEPALWTGEINPNKEQKKLIEDLDFIGIATLRYFNIPWRFKKVDEKIAAAWEKIQEQ